jgi:hypothetical protein
MPNLRNELTDVVFLRKDIFDPVILVTWGSESSNQEDLFFR